MECRPRPRIQPTRSGPPSTGQSPMRSTAQGPSPSIAPNRIRARVPKDRRRPEGHGRSTESTPCFRDFLWLEKASSDSTVSPRAVLSAQAVSSLTGLRILRSPRSRTVRNCAWCRACCVRYVAPLKDDEVVCLAGIRIGRKGVARSAQRRLFRFTEIPHTAARTCLRARRRIERSGYTTRASRPHGAAARGSGPIAVCSVESRRSTRQRVHRAILQ